MESKDELRFFNKINKTDTCWFWTAGCFANGYGLFAFKSKPRLAHRISFLIHNKKEASGVVRHTCDNPKCVNPKHLIEGTQYQNIHDMISRGRRVISKGENNGHSKLTNEQVKDLRILYERTKFNQTKKAIELGISQSTLSRILNRKYYSEV
jgi:hypothetical protein